MMNHYAEQPSAHTDLKCTSLTLTVPQMAKELNISRNTAYELTKQKGFPCFRVGKRVLVNRDMLQAWLDEQCSRIA